LPSDPPLPATAEAVLTFLDSVGRRSEAELYLRLFRQIPKASFAIIGAEGPVVRQALGSLLEQLEFLSQLGLSAPVVVGLREPKSAALGAEQLAHRLPSVGLTPELVRDFSGPRIQELLLSGVVPILHFDPAAGQSQLDRSQILGTLARELGTRRVVLLRREGGLGPRGDEPLILEAGHSVARHSDGISVVDLRRDLSALVAARALPKSEEDLLRQCQALLGAADSRSLTVSVTSPLNLLRELFTVKGAGTLIKTGTEILRRLTYADVDVERLQRLLESSFERRLVPGFFDRPPLAVYLEKDYRGAAIVEPGPIAPYLTKFAVEPFAQGDGLGQDLWQALIRDQTTLVWRCRPQNWVRKWYANLCDGLQRLPEWHVFWRGLAPDQVPLAVADAISRPRDLEA
jgi:hypothetical protein